MWKIPDSLVLVDSASPYQPRNSIDGRALIREDSLQQPFSGITLNNIKILEDT
jgi:hypothetical protein